jgi:hypothetical protein
MKNIHILPTEKPSRLHYYSVLNFGVSKENLNWKQGRHIYITSDEQIKDDDWVYCPVLKKAFFICLDSILMFKNLLYDSEGNSVYKKEWLKKIYKLRRVTTTIKLQNFGWLVG